MHIDMNGCVPPPQVAEQDEDSIQYDQAGHGCVLHGSSLVQLVESLPKLCCCFF